MASRINRSFKFILDFYKRWPIILSIILYTIYRLIEFMILIFYIDKNIINNFIKIVSICNLFICFIGLLFSTLYPIYLKYINKYAIRYFILQQLLSIYLIYIFLNWAIQW